MECKSPTLRSMRCSASPRWMRLMMSLRSPSARSVGSAFSDRCHRAGPAAPPGRGAQACACARSWRTERAPPAAIGPGRRSMIAHCCAASRASDAVELGPAIRLDLGVELAADLKVASRSEFESGEMRGAGAHALADVVARDHQVAAIIAFAAHDDVDVGIFGVPVIDRGPNRVSCRDPAPPAPSDPG